MPAALPWIKVYGSLPGHEKARKLAKALDDRRAWTYVIELWFWASENCPDGDLSLMLDEEIGVRAGWLKAPAKFAQALRDAGFLDPDGTLHNWTREQAAHAVRLEKDRARKAKSRAPSGGVSAGQSVDNTPFEPSDSVEHVADTPQELPLRTLRSEILDRKKEDPRSQIRTGGAQEHASKDPTEAHFDDHLNEDREEPPLWEPPEAAVAPQRKITAPTPDREPVVDPEPPVTRWNGGPPVGPRGAAQAVASLKDAYNLLRKTLDSAGLWKEFDFHEGEVIERALRAHPLSAAPSPYDCLTIEVIAGMQADDLWRKPNMQRLRVALKDTNLEMAIGTARAKARGFDPSAKQAPAKPAVQKPVYWEPTEVPNATTCPPDARPKFMGRQPEPEVKS